MRDETNREKLEAFLRELGQAVTSPGRIYLTGGGTAVLHGWRTMTIDVDLKALPEPAGLFEAIARLKDRLSINIEMASPDDFIPVLPGWEDRSLFIVRHGKIDFYHYDPYSQALSKLERSHARDETDVQAMAERGLIDKSRLWEVFQEIEPALLRYPALDPAGFRRRVATFCES